MGRLAVVAPWHGRHENTLPILYRVLLESSRPPDWTMVVVEDERDADAAYEAWFPLGSQSGWSVHIVRTPRDDHGKYALVPYSLKINKALDLLAKYEYIAYLTNDSLPHPDKYRLMVEALDANPDIGVVYCGQKRNGNLYYANRVVDDAHAVIDHTQVMHRNSPDRWPTGIRHMTLGDAEFWRLLHARFGPFHPVAPDLILDETQQTPDGITASAGK